MFVRMTDQLFPRGGEYEAFCAQQGEAPRSRVRALTMLRERSDASFAAVRDLVDKLTKAGTCGMRAGSGS